MKDIFEGEEAPLELIQNLLLLRSTWPESGVHFGFKIDSNGASTYMTCILQEAYEILAKVR